MFQNIPGEVQAIILNNLQTKYFKAGERVYVQGNPNKFIGVVYVGSVEYMMGKRAVVREKNQVFFKEAFQDKGHATIMCREEAIILVLDQNVKTIIDAKLKSDIETRQKDELTDLLKSTFFSELHIKDKKAKQFYDDCEIEFFF